MNTSQSPPPPKKKIVIQGIPVKKLKNCGGIAQPNEKISQQIIACSKENFETEIKFRSSEVCK